MKILAPLLLTVSVASAAEIKWTGTGSVTADGTGGFAGLAAVGDPVEIVMTFDSATEVDGRSLLSIDGAFAGRAWFFGAADLSITVTIGGTSWTGEMPTIPERTNVMESVCWDVAGNPDWFKATLDSARGGSYPAFPYEGSEDARSLEIEFRDDTSPAELFTIHQLPDTLSCVHEMTSASGAVRAGGDAIPFSLDPATVKVTQPGVPLSIALVSGGIELGWDTEDGKYYRLESTADLKCWIEEGQYFGDGNPIEQFFNPFGSDPRRFYRVVEN